MKKLIVAAAVVILASIGGATLASSRSAGAMSSAAQKWLDALSAEQRERAAFAFDSEERLHWHFVPNEQFPRKGVNFKEMSEPQRGLAHALIKTGLSARGYLTATAIMALEKVLVEIEGPQRRFPRDHEMYWVTVFGTPGDKQAWGWRLEGHHLSVRFDVVGGSMTASSPAFFGSNPAEVRQGPQKGLRVLGDEEDAARALLDQLDATQRSTAVVQPNAPTDILTMVKPSVDPLTPEGLKMSAMNKTQREALTKLIDVYVGKMAPDVAAERMARLKKAGLDTIAFAWAGSTERGQKHYYRVQGPTFLIEYDNTQNDGNHIHSVWRDFNGDFGRDLLREHVKALPH
ncbi:MAG TPA: DUF3500 domain-containing protein [Vicinamibacterales bacterium]|nr:DUF3500 domain-containing protein [Vicinamibacterales bacterium]